MSNLETALIIIFTALVAALLAQLCYVSWHRRVFRRQTNTVGGGGVSHFSSSESSFSAKELLYFFSTRPERNSLTDSAAANDHNMNSNQQPQTEVNDIELLKIRGVFGPPTFLFTVHGEERGNLKSSADINGEEEKQKIDDELSIGGGSVILGECLTAMEETAAVDIGEYDTTPFSTPCASPAYFTPSDSPVHDKTTAFER